MEKLWVRNPSTGIVEIKEFAGQDAILANLRISDPVLTTIAQGYSNQECVGDKLLPVVKTDKETGRFPAFGKESFVIPGDIKIPIGGRSLRMHTSNGYVTFSLSKYGLKFGIEERERNEFAGSPDQLLNMRLMQQQEKIALYRENLQATLLTTTSNYGTGFYTSGAAYKWANDGTPITDMRNAGLAVLKANGRKANKAWFTPTAWELFINNESVLKRIYYGASPAAPAQVTLEAVARLLQVDEVVVGYAVNATGTDGGFKKAAGTNNYLWEVANSACAGMIITGMGWGIPAFGYTYERNNSPVIESWYDNDTKSQIYDASHFFDPAVTLNTAGYVITAIA